MHRFAVFDLDGTLYNTHLGVELLRKLSALNAIPHISQQEFEQKYQEWIASDDRTDYYNEHLDIYYNEHLKGVAEDAFHEACRAIAKEAFEHTYRFTFDALSAHKQAGYKIIIISKSPRTAVETVADVLGADYCWGWEFYFRAGKYDGQYEYKNGEDDKRRIVESIMNEHELTLADSYGYGDSRGDITVLELVENVVCINPDRLLRDAAEQRSWRIENPSATIAPIIHSSVASAAGSEHTHETRRAAG